MHTLRSLNLTLRFLLRIELSLSVRLVTELGVWLAAGAALWASGHQALAIAFVTVAVVSGSLNALWRETGPGSLSRRG